MVEQGSQAAREKSAAVASLVTCLAIYIHGMSQPAASCNLQQLVPTTGQQHCMHHALTSLASFSPRRIVLASVLLHPPPPPLTANQQRTACNCNQTLCVSQPVDPGTAVWANVAASSKK